VRGLTISAHGGLDQIELRQDLPVPELGRDTDVRVRLRAAAINHLDLFVVGGLPNVQITPPWILGSDGMGVVDSVGSAVTGISAGDTVVLNPGISDRTCKYCLAGDQPLCPNYSILGEQRPGTLAEFIVVPAVNVARVPATTDEAEAAAFTLATLTAWRMLVTRADLQPGERVLIWGIGGGVALAALQIARERSRRRRDAELRRRGCRPRDSPAHPEARRERRGGFGRRGDVGPVARRAGQEGAPRHLRRNVGAHGHDRRPPAILEPVEHSRLHDGK
jgi:NADPH:quinone reductase-like Zn-dependent oxidoreductase